MNKKIIYYLFGILLIGVAAYFIVSRLQEKTEPIQDDQLESSMQQPEKTIEREGLDLDLTRTHKEALRRTEAKHPVGTIKQEVKKEQAPEVFPEVPETSKLDSEPVLDAEQALPEEPQAPNVEPEESSPVQDQPLDQEQLAQEKVKAFEENMENLKKQADEELSRMSPEERAEAERNMEQVQQNMAETMERLENMSPEEREQELAQMEVQKNEIMETLKDTNPEAYKMFKSLEEVGETMQDLPTNQAESGKSQ